MDYLFTVYLMKLLHYQMKSNLFEYFQLVIRMHYMFHHTMASSFVDL